MSYWGFDQPDEPLKHSRDVATLAPVKLSFQQKLALKDNHNYYNIIVWYLNHWFPNKMQIHNYTSYLEF